MSQSKFERGMQNTREETFAEITIVRALTAEQGWPERLELLLINFLFDRAKKNGVRLSQGWNTKKIVVNVFIINGFLKRKAALCYQYNFDVFKTKVNTYWLFLTRHAPASTVRHLTSCEIAVKCQTRLKTKASCKLSHHLPGFFPTVLPVLNLPSLTGCRSILNTSNLHGGTTYLTSTTQLVLIKTIPSVTICQSFRSSDL